MKSLLDRLPPGVLALGNLLVVLVVFFWIPIDTSATPLRFFAGLAITLGGIAVAGVIVVREFVREVSGDTRRFRAIHLLLVFEIMLALFALAYYGLEVHRPDSMAGIETRLDALYFAATTMATVGYGDIHASDQVAKAVATFQLLFDTVFIGAFLRLITSDLGARAKAPAEGAAER